ncbi:MAG: nodulation protein E [Gammaproteobacteria bacterium]|nr:nodulation protein E [Gammaproteobacteria bacterium]
MANIEKPLSQSDLKGPARDFADFCKAEFERRRNSDSPFDESSYQEAMELVLRKLVASAEEV